MSTVLIVDDSPQDCLLAQNVLENAGFEMLACDHLSTAFQWLERQSFDVILLDLRLRDSTTEETLAAIPRLSKHCTVVFTGHGDPEVRIRALSAGAYGAINKNVLEKPGELLRQITIARSKWQRDHETLQLMQTEGNTALVRRLTILEDKLEKQDRESRWKELAAWGRTSLLITFYVWWTYAHPDKPMPSFGS